MSSSQQVMYETLGFLEKNRDTLKSDVIALMKGASELMNKVLLNVFSFHSNS